eukprot:TRINITY_DN3908_c0_g1_i2.p1 TRINITY_DN3908_c0_g1~~TRINITY_DN3908_c0_g1_i2.p1  ORF type:complete len:100 (-),score=20.62 TRINITY_DN3908_c0_g1_i2:240-539(-)
MGEIDRYACENVNKLLVGNKCDLNAERTVDVNAAKEFAEDFKIPFIETSAKTGFNVEKCFVQIATAIKNRMSSQNVSKAADSATIKVDKPRKDNKGCKC